MNVGDRCWEKVDLGSAVVTTLNRYTSGESVLVTGHQGGKPFVAAVDPGGRVTLAWLAGSGPVLSVTTNGTYVEAVVESAPAARQYGQVEYGLGFLDQPDTAERTWLTTVGDCHFTVMSSADGRLTALDSSDIPLPDEPGLFSTQPNLKVTGMEGFIAVAGVLRESDQEPRPQLWTVPDEHEHGWVRIALKSEPEAFTDTENWALGFWVAGHTGTRPVTYDHEGHALDMPDVSLDPDHPQVCLAAVPITAGHSMGLALQSAHDGPQLWLGSAKGWDVVPLPPGRLDAARMTTLDATRSLPPRRLWCLIDGSLHKCDLDELNDAS